MSFTSEIIERRRSVEDRELPVSEINAHYALSIALGPPAQMEISSPELLASAFSCCDHSLQNLGYQAADAWESALRQRDSLAVTYARLFLGPFEILAPPYASFYLERNHQIMGEVSRYAANAYAEAGLLPQSGSHEAPDHICCELEFMYFVAFKKMATDETIWLDRQQRFWSEHLVHWLPAFCDCVVQADLHPFYNSIAKLLSKFADHQTKQIKIFRNTGTDKTL